MKTLNDLLNRFSKNSVKPELGAIGLEFAREAMYMVQLQKQADGTIHLRARASQNYPMGLEELLNAPQEIKKIVANLLGQDKFSGNKIVSTLPPGHVRLLPVTYQKSPERDEEQDLLQALKNRLGGNLENYVIDFLPVRRSEEQESGLAIAAIAKQDDVVRYLDLLNGCKLNVSTLDINPIAIKRLVCAMSPSDSIKNVLIINFGRFKSYFTMLSGRRLIFDHEVDFGEKLLLDKLASELDISVEESHDLVRKYCFNSVSGEGDDEADLSDDDVFHTVSEIIKPLFIDLAEEITRALIYIASETRGESPEEIFLVGSISRWKGADTLLNSLLDISVHGIPNPLQTFPRSDRENMASEGDGMPELAVATGLALRGLYSDE